MLTLLPTGTVNGSISHDTIATGGGWITVGGIGALGGLVGAEVEVILAASEGLGI